MRARSVVEGSRRGKRRVVTKPRQTPGRSLLPAHHCRSRHAVALKKEVMIRADFERSACVPLATVSALGVCSRFIGVRRLP
jgi:hypothetical protein